MSLYEIRLTDRHLQRGDLIKFGKSAKSIYIVSGVEYFTSPHANGAGEVVDIINWLGFSQPGTVGEHREHGTFAAYNQRVKVELVEEVTRDWIVRDIEKRIADARKAREQHERRAQDAGAREQALQAELDAMGVKR